MNQRFSRRQSSRIAQAAPLACVSLLVLPLAATAEEEAPAWSVSAARVHQLDADLDAGGEAGMVANRLGVSGSYQASASLRVGAELRLEQQEWDFESASAFAASEPWDDVRSAGLSVQFHYAPRPQWRVSVAPTVQLAAERGADAGDALRYGLGLVGTRVFAPDRRFGIGLAVYRDIEKTRVLPQLAFSWRISERMTLGNPFPTGPAGGGGVELEYRLSDGWSLAGGAGYRMHRFRLDDEGVYGDAVAESRGAPAVARLSYASPRGLRVDAYAGVVFAGELRIEDIAGAPDISEDYDGAPTLFGVSFHVPL